MKELYIYSSPKLPNEQKQPFNILHILCISLYSSLSLLSGSVALGVIVMILYLGLSLLSFLDKDLKSRYMKLGALCIINISVTSISICTNIYPDYKVIWSVIFGVVLFVVYEIVVFIKIKKSLYSAPSNNKQVTATVSVSAVLIFTLLFNVIRRFQILQNLTLLIIVLLCATMILASAMSVQKLIVYSFTKNKVDKNN